MKDTKFELHSNALYGIEKWESHLEEMAEEGWICYRAYKRTVRIS